MDTFKAFDPESDMITLSFATRLLLSELDKDIMIERSLESLADFSRSERAGIFLLDISNELLSAEGCIHSGAFSKKSSRFPLDDASVMQVIANKKPDIFGLAYRDEVPWPASRGGPDAPACLCAPLVAADNRVTGIVTFEYPSGTVLETVLTQPLLLFLTVVAVGLETARLFQLAVNDGLTGLFVRRYFDLRLKEEITRIKRYGGSLALLVVDIDHFKHFNDTYGHQMGDQVLREIASLMKTTVRLELDVVCRYGGEEFAVIMPSTDLSGALVVSRRIQELCQNHAIPGPGGPLEVTLSGGISVLDTDNLISEQELFRRADEALYHAKQNGRNQVQVWHCM